jgi:glycosyltransferase involved in cell wall biosynthesis
MAEHAVALITHFEWVSVSTSVLNTATFLSERGYDVDLYLIPSERFPPPALDSPGTRLLPASDARFPGNCLKLAWRYRKAPHAYRFIIGFDPQGGLLAGVMSLIWRAPYLFHSLELMHAATWKQRLRERIERFFIRRAEFVLVQDDRRAAALAAQYRLPRDNVLLAVNGPMGDPLPERSNFLREKFRISAERRIVLAVGSLMRETMVDRVVQASDAWPDEYVLVLHGWVPDASLEAWLRQQCTHRPARVYLSTELLPEQRKYDVFQSADIGLVLYDPRDTNLRLAAGSAGKLLDFMRVGVPVIGNDIEGMRDLVEGNNVGRVVAGPERIDEMLAEVWARRDELRASCFSAYQRYRFEASYAAVLDRVEAACPA